MKLTSTNRAYLIFLSLIGFCCQEKAAAPSALSISDLKLKRGEMVSCGPGDKQFGSLEFKVTCHPKAVQDFALGVKLLHSFEYDEAEKVFADVIEKDPQCAMAYWGVAMSNFHALWAPPSDDELKKGSKAIEIARSINQKSDSEASYIEAIAAFYKGYATIDHRSRCLAFEVAMQRLRERYPEDHEASIFYALALNAAADPADKSFSKQKKAGQMLNALYKSQPNHPGIIHYIIHTYDSPELAEFALPAARKYASVAPSSAHALHMPSHIFTRLGLWEECISSNKASVDAAQCYAESAGIKGHWDEELHGLDYLMYAYLQRGQNHLAKEQLNYLDSIHDVHPSNFKVAYAFAAMPCRYVLENKNWHEAAALKMPQKKFSWDDFPWQQAMIHFTKAMGALHTRNRALEEKEFNELRRLQDVLVKQKDAYKAGQVAVQIKIIDAWKLLKNVSKEEAISQMSVAAEMEDGIEKHPVTPGEVLPAREMLGDMFMEAKQWDRALMAYETNLKKCPNRFNGLYGAGLAAERSGDFSKATIYYKRLMQVADVTNSNRNEIKHAEQFLKKH